MSPPDIPPSDDGPIEYMVLSLGIQLPDFKADVTITKSVQIWSINFRGEEFAFDAERRIFRVNSPGEEFASNGGVLFRRRWDAAKTFPPSEPPGDREALSSAEIETLLAPLRELVTTLLRELESGAATVIGTGVRQADSDRTVSEARRDPARFVQPFGENLWGLAPGMVQLTPEQGRAEALRWLSSLPSRFEISQRKAEFSHRSELEEPSFTVRIKTPELLDEAFFRLGGWTQPSVHLGPMVGHFTPKGRIGQLSVGSRNYRAQSGRLVEEFVPTLPAADSPNFGASLMASMRSGPRLGNAASAEYTDSLLGSLRYELELCLRAIDAGTAKATSALQHGGRRPEPDLGVDPDCHGDPAYNIPPERGLQLVGDWLRETLPNIAIADAPE